MVAPQTAVIFGPPPPQARARVARRLGGLVAAMFAGYSLLFSRQLDFSSHDPDRWWLLVAAVAMLPPVTALGIGSVRGSQPLLNRAAMLFGGGFLATIATWVATRHGVAVTGSGIGWLAGMTTMPCLAVAIVWPVDLVVAYAVVAATATRSIAVVATATGWDADTFVDCVANILLNVVVAALARVGVDAAGDLDRTWADAHATAAVHAAERARSAERTRMADLLHDWVLATLLAAARQPPSEALRNQARLALRKLQQTSDVAGEANMTAEQTVAAVTLALSEVDPKLRPYISVVPGPGDATFPTEVVTEFSMGAAEAVRNSRRHAGPSASRTASVVVGPDCLAVDICDDGPGFDIATQPLGYGLRRLHGRIGSLDSASVEFDSDPHRGTAVRMRWRRMPSDDQHVSDFRVLNGVRPWIARYGAALFGISAIVCAVASYTRAQPVGLVLLAVVIVAASGAGLVLDRHDPLPIWATSAATVGPSAANLVVLAISVPPITAPHLWPLFLSSSFTPVLCFRGRQRAAWALLVLMSLPPIILADCTGETVGYWVLQGFGGVGAMLLGIFFTWTIRPVMHDIHRLRRNSTADHATTAAAASAAAERIQYLATLESTALPMLDRIANRSLTGDERHEAATLEAGLRSMIRAPRLVDTTIDREVDGARARGVDVVLIDDSNSDRLTGSARQRFIETIASQLDNAPPSATVTVRLTPDHHKHPATIVTTHAGRTLRRITTDNNGQISETGSGTVLVTKKWPLDHPNSTR